MLLNVLIAILCAGFMQVLCYHRSSAYDPPVCLILK
jgi:hypothetical protein